MSAWICSDRHINLIAAFAATNRLKVQWRGKTIDCAAEPQRVATVLLNENYRSVNYRYDKDDGAAIVFDGTVIGGTPGMMLKQINCYDYQACECPDYDRSLAKAIVNACTTEVEKLSGKTVEQIEKSADYDRAPWGID